MTYRPCIIVFLFPFPASKHPLFCFVLFCLLVCCCCCFCVLFCLFVFLFLFLVGGCSTVRHQKTLRSYLPNKQSVSEVITTFLTKTTSHLARICYIQNISVSTTTECGFSVRKIQMRIGIEVTR